MRSTLGQGSTFSVFLPAAETIPAAEVKDITETGGLRPIKSLHLGDLAGHAEAAAPGGAVATVGTQIESIPLRDSSPEAPAVATSPARDGADDELPHRAAGDAAS